MLRARAERFLSVVGDGRYAEMRRRLDDSELGKYATIGVTENDLVQDLDILRQGTGLAQDGIEKIRFDKLRLRAEHALLTYRFLNAAKSDDAMALATMAKTLHAFRLANFKLLDMEGYRWFSKRGNERTAWTKAGYLK